MGRKSNLVRGIGSSAPLASCCGRGWLEFRNIFSIHYFFAEGKKVKGVVKNDVFGGWDR